MDQTTTNAVAIRLYLNHGSNLPPVSTPEYMTFYKGLSAEERQEYGDYARANA